MKKQIFWEDVSPGDIIPALTECPTPRQLVMWAGAAGEFSEMHYDKDFAISRGFPGVIVFGMLTNSYLTKMLMNWAGESGAIKKFKTTNRKFILVDKTIVCRGCVKEKFEECGKYNVRCDFEAESEGEICVVGEAVLTLPTR